MAISKEDASILTEKQRRDLSELEARIDARLRDDYHGEPLSFNLAILVPGEKVLTEIIRRYIDRGWKVELNKGNTNERSLLFS